MDEHGRSRILLIGLVIIPVLLAGIFVYKNAERRTADTMPTSETPSPSDTEIRPFPEVSTQARAAIVYDINAEQALYEKDADAILPLASITKLMTALVAVEFAPSYSLVTITPHMLKEEGESGLVANETWDLRELTDFMLVASSNDAARAIGETIGAWHIGTGTSSERSRRAFVDKMNDRAERLGLRSVTFSNETGLDISTTSPGATGSARDAAKLLAYMQEHQWSLLEKTILDKAVFRSKNLVEYSASNTNPFTKQIPNLKASKTGYTDLAGGNLAVIIDAGEEQRPRPIAIVVLGSNFTGRFEDIKALASTTRSYLSKP